MSQDESAAAQVGGACLCGAVRFSATLPSRFCTHCHCGNCRRAHGAAFVTWVGFREQDVRVVQGADVLTHYGTATGATRSFCSRCGTTLFFAGPRWAGETHVARANIEGKIDRDPQAHFYVDHGADWYAIADDLPRYGGPQGDTRKPRDSQPG